MGMLGSGRRLRRMLRLGGAVAAVWVVSAVAAPAALADGLLDSGSVLPASNPVTGPAAAQTALTPATDAAEEITEQPLRTVEQTAAPALQPAQQAVVQTVEPLAATAQPVLTTVSQTTAPVVQTTEQVLGQTVQPIVETASQAVAATVPPAVKAGSEALGGGMRALTPQKQAQNQSAGAGESEKTASSSAASASPAAGIVAPSSARETSSPAVTPKPGSKSDSVPADRSARSETGGISVTPLPEFQPLPSAPSGDRWVTPKRHRAVSSQSDSPLSGLPGGPLTALATASASAGAGALVILLAALAAALHLAAPGLGRRFRLRLAPWPRPIPDLSLERPG